MWASVEYASGTALAAADGAAEHLAEVTTALHPVAAGAATAAISGRVTHAGTQLRASYRWQPRQTVTAVNSYEAMTTRHSWASMCARRCVLATGCRRDLKRRDVTNLLAQGYHPFLSADGRTLFLAQSPRTVEAGLAFTF